MTDDQLYLFDLKGWLILPGLLHAAQIEEIKAHLYAGGGALEGPAAELLDHPAVAAVLNELLADRDLSDAHHNFRCEGGFTTVRQPGWQPTGTAVPHVVRPPSRVSPMRYQASGDRIFSGLTHVCWELNHVGREDGGTRFRESSSSPACPLTLRKSDRAVLPPHTQPRCPPFRPRHPPHCCYCRQSAARTPRGSTSPAPPPSLNQTTQSSRATTARPARR